jgi:DNA-binding NarL/FixJ family response regulator
VSTRVLIVDDSAPFREVARELLERRGYAVVGEADSAAAAIDATGRLAPDAALVDVRLPDATGFDLARALTRRSPAPAVLLVSADHSTPPEELVRSSGARGFALKRTLVKTDLSEFWPSP